MRTKIVQRRAHFGVLVAAAVTGFLGLVWSAVLAATEPPPAAVEIVQDQLKNESVGERVMPDARDWQLDESVFTELKPFTAPERAIRLPEDQQE